MVHRPVQGTRTIGATALILLLWLSGCLGDETPVPTPPEPPVLPDAYDISCAAGDGFEAGAACPSRIEEVGRTLQEPYLAVYPLDTNVRVVATQAASADSLTGVERPRPGATAVAMVLHVSEDGGADWVTREVPYAPTDDSLRPPDGTLFSDPLVAFEASGRLHAAGMVINDAPLGTTYTGWRLFHMTSDDLGETWSEPTVLGDAQVDRPWMDVTDDGRVAIAWREQDSSDEHPSRLAWNFGDGWTTVQLEADGLGCVPGQGTSNNGPTNPVITDDAIYVACGAYRDGEPVGPVVWRLDDGLTIDAHLEANRYLGTRFLGLDDDRPVLLSGNDLVLLLSRRGDDGAWSDAARVYAEDGILASWDIAIPTAFAMDPWGRGHVIVRDSSACGDVDPSCAQAPLAYLIADQDGPREEHLLRPASASTSTSLADDYHGLVFVDGLGVGAWTRDGGIETIEVRAEA